jgi:hypothetical protein
LATGRALDGPIRVTPEPEWWSFLGDSRYDKLLAGGVKHGIVLSPDKTPTRGC